MSTDRPFPTRQVLAIYKAKLKVSLLLPLVAFEKLSSFTQYALL